jgi:hypothetical protein
MRPAARWVTRADHDGTAWLVHAPIPWQADLHMEVLEHPGDAAVVLGIDVPIGVPLAWARQTGVRAFGDVLTRMTDGTWPRFAEPATVPQEIAPDRPFYPRAPGGTSRAQLVQGLGLQDEDDLRRRCDAAVPGAMPAAAPLFWLVGAQQVGRAALTAWQEVIAPLMQLPHVRLWPMDGHLGDLAQAGHTVIAEAYPRAAYEWPLALPGGRWSKRRQADRALRGRHALDWAAACGVPMEIDGALRDVMLDGFGSAPTGEDAFDSVMGALQVVAVLEGLVPDMPPDLSPEERAVEGWILGRPA